MKEKKELKLFIWTNFCRDYTSGMAFAIATDEVEARKLIKKNSEVYIDDWGDLEIRSLDKRIGRSVRGGG